MRHLPSRRRDSEAARHDRDGDARPRKGVNKAIAQYQDLRKQYYGAQAYDFTDVTLFNAANAVTDGQQAG